MQVSNRAVAALAEALPRVGIDPTGLLEGTSLDARAVRDTRGRLPWSSFCVVLDNVARACAGRVPLAHVGQAFHAVPAFGPVQRVGALLLEPRQVYAFFSRWIGPSLFPRVLPRLFEQAGGKLLMTLELPRELRGSRTFFEISHGGIAAMPSVIVLPHAEVEADLDDHGGRYLIAPPPSRAVGARLLGRLRLLAKAQQAVAGLEHYGEELRESYEALLRSRQDFRDLVEKMSEPVVVHRDGVVVWGNLAFARSLGLPSIEPAIGLHILHDIIHPDDRPALAASMSLPALPNGAPPRRFRAIRRDGRTLLMEISPPQIVDFEGGPARLVVGRDVTERQAAESALLVADRMASLGLVAAGVAHEINNPLAYVHANLGMAVRELSRLHAPAPLREALAAAVDGTERVRAIVRDLRSFARGDLEARESVDLRALAEATIALARRQIERKARLRVALDGLPEVRGDRARLGQVLLNLLLNAADAIEDGAPERNEIAVLGELRDDHGARRVVLRVRDTGSGIPPEHLGRLFEPFFTTKPEGQGTGLGLSMCQRIVQGLGGTISVDSTVGVGSEFAVSLDPASPPSEAQAQAQVEAGQAPASSPPPASAKGASSDDASVRSRARVLVVDDEPKLLAVLSALLSEHFDVVGRDRARAALELLRADPAFDALLCDLSMSEMTGAQLFDAIATERPGLERRMIFMTGGALALGAESLVARAGRPCLEKPFEPEEMLAALREVISTRA
jgi:PAS domain S-box-containing protein